MDRTCCLYILEEFRENLNTPPVLAYPSFDRDFVLETDAFVNGLGAVLAQVHSDGKLYPISYLLVGADCCPLLKRTTAELETLAVV